MAGTVAGGKAAAETNKRIHGADFYARIGALGGSKGTTGGFAAYVPRECALLPYRHHKANCAGKRGGHKSRRTKAGVR